MYDLIIRNANTRIFAHPVDIAIDDSKIVEIEEKITRQAQREIDATGKLVSESFVNPHLHLCKVYTLLMMTEDALKNYHGADMGKAMTAIEAAAKIKEQYAEKWIIGNVRKALQLSISNGVTHVRAFADVDAKAKLEGIKALIKARDEFAGTVAVQTVAFAQDGIVREPGAYELMQQAMELGADVVGGIPWIEFTEADEQQHIDQLFTIAQQYDKDISMLVDDAGDPSLKTLEMLAVKTIASNYHGRVLAHHARAMALYPKPYFMKLVALLKRARMGVISDPHTGPLHARVQEMIEENALVALGQDDISDAYYPYGRNNMLEVAFLVSHILWMTTRDAMEKIYDMITIKAAQTMNIDDYGLKVGKTAHLVVLQDENVLEAFRNHREPAYVISHGKVQ